MKTVSEVMSALAKQGSPQTCNIEKIEAMGRVGQKRKTIKC